MKAADHMHGWMESFYEWRSGTITSPMSVIGEIDSHLGPRLERARAVFLVEPSTVMEIEVNIAAQTSEEQKLINWAIYGFLDVVLASAKTPICRIRITLISIEIDPVSSSAVAFRQAGRNAGNKFLAARIASLGVQIPRAP